MTEAKTGKGLAFFAVLVSAAFEGSANAQVANPEIHIKLDCGITHSSVLIQRSGARAE